MEISTYTFNNEKGRTVIATARIVSRLVSDKETKRTFVSYVVADSQEGIEPEDTKTLDFQKMYLKILNWSQSHGAIMWSY